MTQVYFQNGRTFMPADSAALNLQERLPVGTYVIGVTPKGYHLEQVEDFELPPKLYGDVNKRAERILRTFADRPSGTGVLLSGQKGSGKTMLTKRISQKALGDGVITILINQPLYGEAFNAFLQSISQPAIVLFDEFEKVYDREDQQKLLTIFDGTYASKKLFLLTCNDRYRIDSYMHNRPGRLYYALDFGGLDREFISEYCDDNLKAKSRAGGVLTVSGFFSEFSFDMLKALVEEMNRYDETATEAMTMLNMKPISDDSQGSYTITVMRDGVPVIARNNPQKLNRSPLGLQDWHVSVWPMNDDEEEGESDDYAKAVRVTIESEGIREHESYPLDVNRLVTVDAIKGEFVFATERADTTIRVQRDPKKSGAFNYDLY